MPVQLEMALRLLLAAVLGGIIGFQRETVGKPAGARTLALIGVGSGLFGVVSLLGFPGGNPSMIAAGVVTGVGFLGAGAILGTLGTALVSRKKFQMPDQNATGYAYPQQYYDPSMMG